MLRDIGDGHSPLLRGILLAGMVEGFYSGAMAEGSHFVASLKRPGQWIGVGLMLLFIGLVVLYPQGGGSFGPRASPEVQTARTLALAMFSYANDHDQNYPTGKSSTEVFQKLIDGDYISDPAILYWDDFTPRGKIKATSKVLKPENVCWDVTVPIGPTSPDDMPVVFWTGYRVNYAPNGSAVPLIQSAKSRGIAVCYKSNSAQFRVNDGQADGIVTNFISSDFAPDGKTYRQLTPEGPLAP